MRESATFHLLNVQRLQVLIFTLRIEAGTGLVDTRQVAVTEDDGIRIVRLQRAEQGIQRRLLLAGTGVGVIAVLVKAALIADADAVLVVVAGMATDELFVPRLVQLTVAGDVVVIAGEPEAGIVTGNEVLDGEPTVSASGAAVDDDEIDFTHDCTKNVVMINVMSDPMNFRIFPICSRLFLMNFSIIMYLTID